MSRGGRDKRGEPLLLILPGGGVGSVIDDRALMDWIKRSSRDVTAGGVSAGIDEALHVVERLLGPSSARTTARYMEYRWEPSGS